MTKKEVYEKLNDIDSMTWHYPDDNREKWDYMYEKLFSMLKNATDEELESVNKTYDAVIKILPYKYGYEYEAIKMVPELLELVSKIDEFDLDKNEQQINVFLDSIKNLVTEYLNDTNDFSFLPNPYENVSGKEGLSLSIDSLNSIIENPKYLECFSDKSRLDIIADYVRILLSSENKMGYNKDKLEESYSEGLRKIWQNSLTDSLSNSLTEFKTLFCTISGYNIDQARKLIDRPEQQSCSLISNNEMANYGGYYNKVGFIYPSNSKIICAGSSDLYSNVFAKGVKNREKGSYLATPSALENQTINNIDKKGEDRFHSESYNEVLVDSKPCAICIITMGEKELNHSYVKAKELASELGLPFEEINMLKFKPNITNDDMKYIAYHYYITKNNLESKMLSDEEYKEMDNFINANSEEIFKTYINLVKSGIYTPDQLISIVSEKTSGTRT